MSIYFCFQCFQDCVMEILMETKSWKSLGTKHLKLSKLPWIFTLRGRNRSWVTSENMGLKWFISEIFYLDFFQIFSPIHTWKLGIFKQWKICGDILKWLILQTNLCALAKSFIHCLESKKVTEEDSIGNDYSFNFPKITEEEVEQAAKENSHEFLQLIQEAIDDEYGTSKANSNRRGGNDYYLSVPKKKQGSDYNEAEGSGDSVDPDKFLENQVDTPDVSVCERDNNAKPHCRAEFHSKYRTYSGACNHMKHR